MKGTGAKTMNRDPKAILDHLRQVAADHQTKLAQETSERLDDREREILKWLFAQYQDESKRRWYDPYHVLFSTRFALELVEKENLDRLIVTGIMLHDIGYFAIEDKTEWSTPTSRITHMQEGIALAARVLCENDYTAHELEQVLGMVSVHDNPYIGIEIKGKDRLGLRDCDRVWVMHVLSFYKDLVSEGHRYEHPREFLHDRMAQFYGWRHPFGDEWAITIDRVKKNAPRIEIPTYELTKEYVRRQFEFRIQELRDGGILDEPRVFREYLDHQIEKE